MGSCWSQFRLYKYVSNVCISFISDQWLLTKDFGYLLMCLQKTPVFQNDSMSMDCQRVVQETKIGLSAAAG